MKMGTFFEMEIINKIKEEFLDVIMYQTFFSIFATTAFIIQKLILFGVPVTPLLYF